MGRRSISSKGPVRIFNHLITNSLVHGLETMADRLAKGKEARGVIAIDAELGKGFLNLKYSDDGAASRFNV